MAERQYDILATRAHWFTIPRQMPMRLDGTSFVHFIIPRELPVHRYKVVIESMDTAGPTYRSIGPLKQSVELPHIQYPWTARLGVVPDGEDIPSFEAQMFRGSTYVIPHTLGRNGVFQMTQHGVQRPSGI